ncbi:MAG: EamA family transporter RarD [Marinosulfonomonas sp.]|nr:EamA family transporter RarD [Marinosulfonomonas sp.]
MTRAQHGILAMVGACMIWGLSPLFYKALANVPPLEVLSHRTIWSLVFFGLVLAGQRRLGQVAEIFKSARLLLVMIAAAVMISLNWGIFIWSIQVGRAVEASLGYFIFPLMAVVLGALLFKERLGAVQLLAVAMVAGAVVLLTWGLGVMPWIPLVLAASFSAYGVIKKKLSIGPVVSVTGEVLLLLPLALIWLWGVHWQGWVGIGGRNLATFGTGWRDTLLLMLSGPMTATPLILFSYAAKRLDFATQGLVQYLNPSLQFTVAVLAFGEVVSRWHAIAFPVIWAALALYSVNALRQEKAARRASVKPSTESTTSK